MGRKKARAVSLVSEENDANLANKVQEGETVLSPKKDKKKKRSKAANDSTFVINVNQTSSILNLYKKRNELSPSLHTDVLSENNSKKKKGKVSNKEIKTQSNIDDGFNVRNNPEKKKKKKKKESEATAKDSDSEAIIIFARRPKEKENVLEEGTVSTEVIEVKPKKKKKKKKKGPNNVGELNPNIDDQDVAAEMIISQGNSYIKSKKKRNEAQVEDTLVLKPKFKTKAGKGIDEGSKSPTEVEVKEPEEISISNTKKRSKRKVKIGSEILQETEIESKLNTEVIKSNGTNTLEEITLTPKKKPKNNPKKAKAVLDESKDEEVEKIPVFDPNKSNKEIASLETLAEKPSPSEPNCDSSDEDIKTPSKRRRKAFSESSSDDEIKTPSRKKSKMSFNSDDDSEPGTEEHESPTGDNPSSRNENPNTPSRIKRCNDSSDEEDETIKARPERRKRLQKLAEKVRNKRGRKLGLLDNEAEEANTSDEAEIDEDNLPMFEHEEYPPDSDEDMKRVVESDEEEDEYSSAGEEEESEEEGEEESEGSDEGGEDEGSDNEDVLPVHLNPYLDQTQLGPDNFLQEFSKSMKALSKTTSTDIENKKRYKKEMGKYQFEVRSARNKAHMLDEKVRYKRNMRIAKFDRGLKEDRNLNNKDDEFHNIQEATFYGERVQVFPHSKTRAKYKGHCELTGCGRTLEVETSKIVGVKKFDIFNMMFMKKKKAFEVEGYYWICRDHMQDELSSSDESYDPSDIE